MPRTASRATGAATRSPGGRVEVGQTHLADGDEPVVVGDLVPPQLLGPAAVHRHGPHVQDAVAGRAQEVGVVGHADDATALAQPDAAADADGGLAERAVDAAVHDAVRLQE